MRVSGLGLLALFCLLASQPSFAQNILKREPHYLAPGSVVYVANGQCGAGKVMKVTGILKGISRRRACVSIDKTYAGIDDIAIVRQ